MAPVEQDPIGNNGRRARRERQLGPDACCLLCGYEKPAGLVVTRRELLEAHHVLGRANDAALTVLLCRNCHAETTETYRVHGVSMAVPCNEGQRILTSLRAFACFFEAMSRACSRLAGRLERYLDGANRPA